MGPAGPEEPPQEATRASTLPAVPNLFPTGGAQPVAGGKARPAARATATTTASG